MVNKAKEKLYAGQTALGVSVMIPSPQIVEMVGQLGFDWVLIDREHGAISRESMELMIMAAQLNGLTAIVRPPSADFNTIAEALDAGAMGIQVPHVRSAAAARQVVDTALFHPQGKRGLAVGTRAAGYGLNLAMDQYVQEANHQILVCVQLEDVEALDNLEEIAQVEGIDVLFIGPSDLSQAMGFPGQKNRPEVRAAINNGIKRILSSGRVAGSAGNTAAIKDFEQQGVRYLYTHLTTLLQDGSRWLRERR